MTIHLLHQVVLMSSSYSPCNNILITQFSCEKNKNQDNKKTLRIHVEKKK